MTKKELLRRERLSETLAGLGFDEHEAEALRRISGTLKRWHEMECGTEGGCIERDGDTGRPYWVSEWGTQWGAGKRTRRPIADREAGARRRLAALIEARNDRSGASVLEVYIQTDPRGAPLYILRPGDVPEGGDPGAYYSRGICVY
jgi:hypothetical protein